MDQGNRRRMSRDPRSIAAAWFDLHTLVAKPVPTANWTYVEDGKTPEIKVAFDARELRS
jgi:hypothetical protein